MYGEMPSKAKAKFTRIPTKSLKRSDPILTIKVWANGMYFAEHDGLDDAIPNMSVPAIMNTAILLDMLANTCSEYAKAKKVMDDEDQLVPLREAKGVH